MVEMMAGEDAALQLPAQESTSSHNLKYRRGAGINILLYIIFLYIIIIYYYILFSIYYWLRNPLARTISNIEEARRASIFSTYNPSDISSIGAGCLICLRVGT